MAPPDPPRCHRIAAFRYASEALEAAAIGGVFAAMGGPAAAGVAAAGAAAASVATTAFTRATTAALDHYGISTSDLQETAIGTAAGLAIDAVQIAVSSRRRREVATEVAEAARDVSENGRPNEARIENVTRP